MLRYADKVEIIEVAPRDGLQALSRIYPVEVKLKVLDLLADAGFTTIEATAFARPDVVPQLSDASELLRRLERRSGVRYRALAPNRKGAERALDAGVDELLGLTTTSDTYNRRNSNMDVEQNLRQLEEMAEAAHASGVPLTVAIGLAFFCPYEGDIPPTRLASIVGRLHASGVRRLYLATSLGMDGPREIQERVELLNEFHPDISVGLHLHNANGMALANAVAAMDSGVRWFEGSIAGMGGGLAAPGTGADTGNVPSEDLVALFEGMQVETGLDVERVRAASSAIAELLGIKANSHVTRAGTKLDVLAAGALMKP